LDTSIRPGLSKFLPLSSERAARTGARRAHRCHSTPWRFFPSTSLSVLPRRFSFINIIAVPRSFLGRLFLLFIAVAVRTPFSGRAAAARRRPSAIGVYRLVCTVKEYVYRYTFSAVVSALSALALSSAAPGSRAAVPTASGRGGCHGCDGATRSAAINFATAREG